MEIWKLDVGRYAIVQRNLHFMIAVESRLLSDDGFVSYIRAMPGDWAQENLFLYRDGKLSNELEILVDVGISKDQLEELLSTHIADQYDEIMKQIATKIEGLDL